MSKICFLGDSITKGLGYGGVLDTDTFAYKAGVASGYLPSEIINAGVSSNTSAMMLERIYTDVISKSPNVCVVMAMANDVSTNTSFAQYKSNIQLIVRALLDGGVKPVLASPPLVRGDAAKILKYKQYLDVLELAASELSVPFVDCFSEYSLMYLCAPTDFVSCYVDDIHQTKSGHSKIASMFTSELWRKSICPDSPHQCTNEIVMALVTDMADYLISGQDEAMLERVAESRSML